MAEPPDASVFVGTPQSSSSEGVSHAGGRSRSGSGLGIFTALGPEELQDKYSRLAHEYSKIKAQNVVLRRATVQEQERAARLDENVKGLDHQLRKAAQEQDLLARHNERLSKRVEDLKAQLEEQAAHTSRAGFFGLSSAHKNLAKANETLQVTNADLESKIRDFEALQGDLHDVRMIATQNISHFHEQLKLATHKYEMLKDSTDTALATKDDEIAHLRKRLNETETRLMQVEDRLVTAMDDLAEARMEAAKRDRELADARTHIDTLVRRRLVVDDTLHPCYSSLNMPHHVEVPRASIEAAERAFSDWKQCAVSLRSFVDSYKMRVGLAMQQARTLSPSMAELYELLSDPAPLVAFDTVADRALGDLRQPPHKRTTDHISTDWPSLGRRVRPVVDYFSRLIPLMSQVLEDECNEPKCHTALQARNRLLLGTQAAIAESLDLLRGIQPPKMNDDDEDDDQDAPPSEARHRDAGPMDAPSVLSLLGLKLKTFSTQIRSKLEFEQHQHLDATSSSAQQAASVAIIAASVSMSTHIVSFGTSLARLTAQQEELLRHQFVNGALLSSLPSATQATDQRFRVRRFLSLLRPESAPASVPYEESLRNVAALQTTSRSQQDMSTRLAQAQDATARLQREKNEWALEQSLLSSRLADEELRAKNALAERDKAAAQAEHLAQQVAILAVNVRRTEAERDKEFMRAEQLQQAHHQLQAAHDRATEALLLQQSMTSAKPQEDRHILDQSLVENHTTMDDEFGDFTLAPVSETVEPPSGSTELSLMDMNVDEVLIPREPFAVAPSLPPRSPATIASATASNDTTASSPFTPSPYESYSPVVSNPSRLSKLSSNGLATTPPSLPSTATPLAVPAVHPPTPTLPAVRFYVTNPLNNHGGAPVDGAVLASRDQLHREALIKSHYETKVGQLMTQLQIADGEAMRVRMQAGVREEALDGLRKEKAALREALERSQDQMSEVRDNLASTEKNYTAQLNMMTEHIFMLNEQLASRDEADRKRRAAVGGGAVPANGGAPTPPRRR